jgi:hypothetical protein
LDAGQLSVPSVSSLPASKNLHNNRRQPALHPVKTRLALPPDPSYNMLFVGFAAHGARAASPG